MLTAKVTWKGTVHFCSPISAMPFRKRENENQTKTPHFPQVLTVNWTHPRKLSSNIY